MILKEFAVSMPLASIILFSFIITLILTLLYKFLTKQEEIKALKERTKALQTKIKAEKDPDKLMELNKELMQMSFEAMRHNMKPMLITFLPLLFVFAWLRALYTGVGDIIYWGKDILLFHTGAGWLLCYIFFSIFFNIVLRKILKVH